MDSFAEMDFGNLLWFLIVGVIYLVGLFSKQDKKQTTQVEDNSEEPAWNQVGEEDMRDSKLDMSADGNAPPQVDPAQKTVNKPFNKMTDEEIFAKMSEIFSPAMASARKLAGKSRREEASTRKAEPVAASVPGESDAAATASLDGRARGFRSKKHQSKQGYSDRELRKPMTEMQPMITPSEPQEHPLNEEFDLRRAVIYSEILKPKFDE